LSAFAKNGAMQGFAFLGVLDPSAPPPVLATEHAPPWTGADPPRAVALAPRHEPIVSFEPVFFATGGRRPARIALASETLVAWRSGRVDGDGPWTPEGFPRLDPKRRFQWRVEAAVDGAPLTAWVPVRGVDEATLKEFAAFEIDMRDLASTPHAVAADVVRCGVYAHHRVWTSLLAAAARLRAADPGSPLAKRARETAVQGLQLDPRDAEILERLLVPGPGKAPPGA
jgi:hypothetical protein